LFLQFLTAKGQTNNCILLQNTDFNGTVINNGLDQRTESAENCHKICQLTLGCHGFSWMGPKFQGIIFRPLHALK
jgi:hypothetical protein